MDKLRFLICVEYVSKYFLMSQTDIIFTYLRICLIYLLPSVPYYIIYNIKSE